MPWKNGLGVTTEIAIEPAGATLDHFDWRLSMARIDASGPFSSFPNIDRLLMVLDGECALSLGDGPAVSLTSQSSAVRFRGEQAAMATLLKGPEARERPVLDLNLMTRRGLCTSQMRRLEVHRHSEISLDADTTVLLCRTAGLEAEHSQGTAKLQADDVLIVNGGGPDRLRLSHPADALIYTIELRRVVTIQTPR
jgi:environmental stress-induced protein Ves